jgi:peptidyl-prolyl cis-trans isomerase C
MAKRSTTTSRADTPIDATAEVTMLSWIAGLRWIAASVPRPIRSTAPTLAPASLALTASMLTIWGLAVWMADDARADMLSSGVFSDQPDPGTVDPSNTPTATPFNGIRPPDTKIANAVSTPPDPLVANVDGHPIYLSDLGEAVKSLPEALRKMPFEVIYPTLLDRMVDHEALVLMARREKLDDDPKVKREVEAATARILEGALLERTAMPQVTEAAIRTRYTQEFANQPSVEEVHARHILVGSEAEAKTLIRELDKGADFASLAKRFSKDPDGARGGDVGFFRRDQVWPAFADLAFSLKPGEIGQTPIFNEFGWHVVQVLERRTVTAPTFAEAHDAIRTQLLQAAVQRVVAKAREGLVVHKFNLNGAAMSNAEAAAAVGDTLPREDRQPSAAIQPPTAPPNPAPQKTQN